jgi:hypothetical protein
MSISKYRSDWELAFDRKRPKQNTSPTAHKKNRAALKAASKARQKQRRSK